MPPLDDRWRTCFAASGAGLIAFVGGSPGSKVLRSRGSGRIGGSDSSLGAEGRMLR